MPNSWLTYSTTQGFIHHWLVAGPYASPAHTAIGVATASQPESGVELPVTDLGALRQDAPELSWRYYRCQDDHWIDLTAFYPKPTRVSAWAYTAIQSPEGGPARLNLSVEGCAPAVWVNGQPVEAGAAPDGAGIQTIRLEADLRVGRNEVLVRFWADGLRETPNRLALRVEGFEDGSLQIELPTEIEADFLELRRQLEAVAEAACLDRYLYGYMDGDRYDRNEPISVRYAGDLAESGELTHRLQSLSGDIFQESTRPCSAGAAFELARVFPLRGGAHHLAILPPAKAYYNDKVQFERKDLFFVQRGDFAAQPAGTLTERRKQALEHAAQRRGDSLTVELAKLSLGQVDRLHRAVFEQAAERIQARQERSVLDALDALSLLLRFSNEFPLPEVQASLESALAGYPYWVDQPGGDGMDYLSESRQIVFHSCEILAGQLLPGRAFGSSGQDGQWHRQHGESLALDWIRQRGVYGFREWDSPDRMEEVLAALANLVELADDDTLREMAAILIDKVLFSLAINSWRGVYGASRGYTGTPGVLSARLEPTSGISRLLWGLGNFNESIRGEVSLALCESYGVPGPIEKIATDRERVIWASERSCLPGGGWEANRVVYRTPDFQLASAQDYAPGQPGTREHVWQATLGPDAIVYTQHPANRNVETTQAPNLWAGNGRLPRVVQWGDVLVALYQLPQEDWLGFTHAYFPAAAFDEYQVGPHWAFARKGAGYLALFAARGLELVQSGKTAWRELRSHGAENAWICHMGQAVLDGSFADFQAKILAMEMEVTPQQVTLTSLRGDTLSVGWQGPLRVNGEVQATTGFKHYENFYCTVDLPAEQMDIIYEGEGIRLTFV